MRRLYNNLTTAGPKVAMIVQPSLRQRSTKSLWVHRWNSMAGSQTTERSIPKFQQTCSCQLGDPVPGCHFTYYIANNYCMNVTPCGEVPTLAATEEHVEQSLVTAINHLIMPCAQHLRFQDTDAETHGVGVERREFCRPLPKIPGYPVLGPGLQRTPDSLNHTEISSRSSSRRRGGGRQTPEANNQAFPTDAKEREKHRKAAIKAAGGTITVKKKFKIVEDHHDDCGDDRSIISR